MPNGITDRFLKRVTKKLTWDDANLDNDILKDRFFFFKKPVQKDWGFWEEIESRVFSPENKNYLTENFINP